MPKHRWIHAGPISCQFASSLWAVSAGRQAIPASGDGILKIWDLEAGVSLASFSGEGGFRTCAVAPDDRTAVAGDAGGQVHILRLEAFD